MNLLGTGWGDPQSQANMALAAGLLRGDLGAGLLGASNAVSQAEDTALKRQYLAAQMANLQSEVDTRKAALAKQQQIADLLTKGLGPQAPMTGQLGSGSFGIMPTAPGVPAIPQAGSGVPGGGTSRIGSMPLDTLALLKAQGLDLMDVYNAAQPKWENVGNYMVNTRDPGFRGGFQPRFDVSQNGQATVTTIGPGGTPQVSAPSGALDTYRQYKQADADVAAGSDLVKVVGPDGAERYVPRSQVLRAAQPPSLPTGSPRPMLTPQAGVTGNFTGSPEQISAQIDQIADPQERANARAAFEEQARRTPGFGQGAPLQATPTSAQAAAAAAQKEQATQTAKDVAEQRKAIMMAGTAAPQNIARYQQIGKLLADVDGGRLTPTGTQIASTLNSLGIKVDANLPNKEAAASLANQAALELRNPSGGAGMPGALSDADRNFLISMTPNQAQTAQGRRMIINAYVAIQQRNQQVAQFARNYEKKYGQLDNGFFDQLQAWSNSNPLFKGQ